MTRSSLRRPILRPRRGSDRITFRPQLERLEDRTVPSTVTNLLDSGPGSLRDAIANTPAGGVVDFQSGLAGTITLTGGLTVGNDLTIDGPGAGVITVSGNHASGVFGITKGTVAISGLTIADGVSSGDGGAGGGGVANYGTLSLTNVVVEGNSVTASYVGGGGIYNAGTLTLTGSTVVGNAANASYAGGGGGMGGGVQNRGPMTMTDCTISDNSAAFGGGGVENDGINLAISSCTFSGNSAGTWGGGLQNGRYAYLTVTNATFSGNTAARGGGIFDANVADGCVLTNCTLSGNSASTDGGGIVDLRQNGLFIANTIVAGNSAPTYPDLEAIFSSVGHNLFGDGGGSLGFDASDLVGTAAAPIDPKLGPLQDNGGPTQTMALLPGSPAVDAGDNSWNHQAYDQRGPNYPRIANGVIDIGAFESHIQAVRNTDDAGPGSLRQAILDANGDPGDDVITFAPGVAGAIDLASPLPALDSNIDLEGPGALTLTVRPAAGESFGVFSIGNGAVVVIAGLTIAGGTAASGGGILNDGGTLTVANCAIADNAGAGVVNASGTMTVFDSTISGNSGPDGGGVVNAATLTLSNSTVADNTAAGAGSGGGVHNAGVLTVDHCTIADNAAGGAGGGIFNAGSGTAALRDTLIAGNQAPTAPDAAGAFMSQGHNLIGDGDGGNGFTRTDLVGTSASPVDPKLGPLQNNGGPTSTLALLSGSPAIDAGDNASPPDVYDQRGPGYLRISNGVIDLGAFEVQTTPLTFVVLNTDEFGPGSLRQAILDADALPGDKIITFAPGVTGVINNATELPNLSTNIDLRGPGAANLTVGGGTITVTNGAAVTVSGLTAPYVNNSDGTLTVNDCVLRGLTSFSWEDLTVSGCAIDGPDGLIVAASPLGSGGVMTISDCTFTRNIMGIMLAAGTMTVLDCTINGGAGISNGGALTVENSTIEHCGGGGVSNSGTATIDGCTIASNSAVNGGGVYNTGTLSITNSTVAGNTAGLPGVGSGGSGGGVYNSGTLSITDSTVVGNKAQGAWMMVYVYHGQPHIEPSAPAVGGGIWNSGTLTVASCTIAYNTAVQNIGPDIGSNGGGVASVGGTATVQNTIIAQNQSPADPDASGSFVSNGHNLIGDGAGAGGFTAPGDRVGSAAAPINPLLGPLQNNGGPTATMALLPGSPALNAGDDSLSPGPYDQRGLGFPRIVNGTIDVGAFESANPYAGGKQFVVAPDQSLWEEIAGGWVEVSPGGTILSASAAQTAQGLGAFAVASDLSLWQYVGGAWTMLSPAGTIQSVSAAPGEQVFAVPTDHSLWEHSGYGWQILSPAGTIQAVSAGSDPSGAGVAFALARDSSLWEYDGGWALLSPAGTIRSISAGARDDVFAVAADLSLWEFGAGGWGLLSPAGTILSIQAGTGATGADVVFALASDHSLWAGGAGGWGLLSPAGTIAALDNLPGTPASGASSNTQYDGVCVTASDGSCWDFDGAAGWLRLFPWLTK